MISCKKIKIFAIILVVLCILYVFLTYTKYISVKTKSNFTDKEYRIIENEFCIDTKKENVKYIYKQGSDRYGIKIAVNEYSAEYLDKILTVNFDKNYSQEKLTNNNFTEYKTSDNCKLQAKEIYLSFQSNDTDLTIKLFKQNGEYYIEAEKRRVENIAVFNNID